MITYEDYCSVIAQGCLTNSKHPSSFIRGVYPEFYPDNCIDFICGLGVNLLHENDMPSLPTHLEYYLGKDLNKMFSFCEKWKFLKTGSEACSASIRIARAYNDRALILSEGYHGFHDSFTSLTPPAYGVKDDFKFKKFESFNQITDEVSAIIIEPVITDWSNQRKIWLQALRKKTKELGIVLIFDETITGFRFHKHSVANHFNISPDLFILGKSLGGGAALSAVGGKAELMDKEYFVSSTFAGEIKALRSSLDFIAHLHNDFEINKIWFDGHDFLEKFNAIYPEKIKINGYPTRGRFEGDELVIALFFQEMMKEKVLFGKSWFYSFPLMRHKEKVLSLAEFILNKIKNNEIKLEGEMPRSAYADKVRSK